MLACKLSRVFGSSFTRGLISKRCLPSCRWESGSSVMKQDESDGKIQDSVKEIENTLKFFELFEPPEVLKLSEEQEKRVLHWNQLHDTFYGPDRDFKNFPTPRWREHPPPTKLAVLPKAWFDMMYYKSGVIGPYVIGIGGILYLLSREIFVLDDETANFMGSMVAGYLVFGRLLKGPATEWADGQMVKVRNKLYDTPVRVLRESAETVKDILKEELEYSKLESLFDTAAKENVDLMLEAEYRRRLNQVHKEVKKRLDYQMELQNAKRRFEQAHMVDWITSSVISSITPELEKQSITSCIDTLKALSKTTQPTV